MVAVENVAVGDRVSVRRDLAREGEGARFDFGRVGHVVRAVEGNQIDVGRFQALDVAANRVTVRRAGTQEEQGRCECVNAFHGKMYKFG